MTYTIRITRDVFGKECDDSHNVTSDDLDRLRSGVDKVAKHTGAALEIIANGKIVHRTAS